MGPDELAALASISRFAGVTDQPRRWGRELNGDLGELRRPLFDRRSTSLKLLVIVNGHVKLCRDFFDVETLPLAFLA
jgi:hypothetical protein